MSIPVIAYGQGCIPYIITPKVGLVIDQNEDFVDAAVKQLLAWYTNPAEFRMVSAAARERFLLLRQIHQDRLEQLFQMLTKQ